LPAGFKAIKVSDNMGRARHIAVTPQGVIYFKSSRLVNGKGVLKLVDKNNDGVADTVAGFGNYIGTGIAVKGSYLYTSSDEEVYRYKLNDKGEVTNPDAPEKSLQV